MNTLETPLSPKRGIRTRIFAVFTQSFTECDVRATSLPLSTILPVIRRRLHNENLGKLTQTILTGLAEAQSASDQIVTPSSLLRLAETLMPQEYVVEPNNPTLEARQNPSFVSAPGSGSGIDIMPAGEETPVEVAERHHSTSLDGQTESSNRPTGVPLLTPFHPSVKRANPSPRITPEKRTKPKLYKPLAKPRKFVRPSSADWLKGLESFFTRSNEAILNQKLNVHVLHSLHAAFIGSQKRDELDMMRKEAILEDIFIWRATMKIPKKTDSDWKKTCYTMWRRFRHLPDSSRPQDSIEDVDMLLDELIKQEVDVDMSLVASHEPEGSVNESGVSMAEQTGDGKHGWSGLARKATQACDEDVDMSQPGGLTDRQSDDKGRLELDELTEEGKEDEIVDEDRLELDDSLERESEDIEEKPDDDEYGSGYSGQKEESGQDEDGSVLPAANIGGKWSPQRKSSSEGTTRARLSFTPDDDMISESGTERSSLSPRRLQGVDDHSISSIASAASARNASSSATKFQRVKRRSHHDMGSKETEEMEAHEQRLSNKAVLRPAGNIALDARTFPKYPDSYYAPSSASSRGHYSPLSSPYRSRSSPRSPSPVEECDTLSADFDLTEANQIYGNSALDQALKMNKRKRDLILVQEAQIQKLQRQLDMDKQELQTTIDTMGAELKLARKQASTAQKMLEDTKRLTAAQAKEWDQRLRQEQAKSLEYQSRFLEEEAKAQERQTILDKDLDKREFEQFIALREELDEGPNSASQPVPAAEARLAATEEGLAAALERARDAEQVAQDLRKELVSREDELRKAQEAVTLLTQDKTNYASGICDAEIAEKAFRQLEEEARKEREKYRDNLLVAEKQLSNAEVVAKNLSLDVEKLQHEARLAKEARAGDQDELKRVLQARHADEDRCRAAKQQVAEMKLFEAKLRAEMSTLREEHSTEAAQLRQQRERAQQERDAAQNQLLEAQRCLSVGEKAAAGLRSEIKQLQDDVKSVNELRTHDLAEFTAQLQRIREEREAAKKRCGVAEEQLSKEKASADKVRAALAALEKDHSLQFTELDQRLQLVQKGRDPIEAQLLESQLWSSEEDQDLRHRIKLLEEDVRLANMFRANDKADFTAELQTMRQGREAEKQGRLIAEQQLSEAAATADQLRTNMAALREAHATEANRLRRERQIAQNERDAAQSQLQEARERSSVGKKEVERLRPEVKRLQGGVPSTGDQAAFTSQLQRIMEERDAAKNGRCIAEQHLSEAQATIDKLRAESTSLREAHSTEADRLRQECQGVQKEQDAAQNQLQEARERLSSEAKVVEGLRSEVKQLQDDVRSATALRESDQAEFQADLQKMREERENAEDGRQLVAQQLSEAEATIDKLRAESTSLREAHSTEADRLRQERQGVQKERDAAENQLQEARERLSAETKVVEGLRLQVRQLQGDVRSATELGTSDQAELAAKLQTMREELENAEDGRRLVAQQLSEAEATIDKLRAESTSLREAHSTEADRLRQECQGVQKKRDAAQNQLQAARERLSSEAKVVEGLRSTVKQLQDNVRSETALRESDQAEFKADLQKMREERENAEHGRRLVAQQLSEAEATIDKLRAESTSLREAHSTEADRLRQERQGVQKERDAAENQLQEARERLSAETKVVDRLRLQLKQLQDDVWSAAELRTSDQAEFTARLQKIREERDVAKDRYDAALQQLSESTSTICALRQEISALQASRTVVQSTVNQFPLDEERSSMQKNYRGAQQLSSKADDRPHTGTKELKPLEQWSSAMQAHLLTTDQSGSVLPLAQETLHPSHMPQQMRGRLPPSEHVPSRGMFEPEAIKRILVVDNRDANPKGTRGEAVQDDLGHQFPTRGRAMWFIVSVIVMCLSVAIIRLLAMAASAEEREGFTAYSK